MAKELIILADQIVDLSKSERRRPSPPRFFKPVSSDLVASLGQNAKARTVAWDLRARIAQGFVRCRRTAFSIMINLLLQLARQTAVKLHRCARDRVAKV